MAARSGPRGTASISVDIPFLDEQAKMWRRKAPVQFDLGLEAGIRAATIEVTAHVKNLLDGPVLSRRTHRLWRSIQPEVFRRFGTIVGIVGTDVEYAAVHEFGGIIRPRSAGGLLVFPIDGGWVSARSVKMPKRPYMSRAFKEKKARVNQLIRQHVLKAVSGQLQFDKAIGGAAGRVVPPSMRRGVGFNA